MLLPMLLSFHLQHQPLMWLSMWGACSPCHSLTYALCSGIVCLGEIKSLRRIWRRKPGIISNSPCHSFSIRSRFPNIACISLIFAASSFWVVNISDYKSHSRVHVVGNLVQLRVSGGPNNGSGGTECTPIRSLIVVKFDSGRWWISACWLFSE